jgi:Skp family chaperone for outer membrane proteins
MACNSSSTTAISNEKEKIEAAAKASRDEFVREMQQSLKELEAKYKALEQRASEAKGDEKKDLDEKAKRPSQPMPEMSGPWSRF